MNLKFVWLFFHCKGRRNAFFSIVCPREETRSPLNYLLILHETLSNLAYYAEHFDSKWQTLKVGTILPYVGSMPKGRPHVRPSHPQSKHGSSLCPFGLSLLLVFAQFCLVSLSVHLFSIQRTRLVSEAPPSHSSPSGNNVLCFVCAPEVPSALVTVHRGACQTVPTPGLRGVPCVNSLCAGLVPPLR